MSVQTPFVPRPWRVIAAEITQEQDSRKIMELVRELDLALEIEQLGRIERSHKVVEAS